MTTLDGLSALQAKRNQATKSARHVPPPRKAPRAQAVDDTSARTETSPPRRDPTAKAPTDAPGSPGPREDSPVRDPTARRKGAEAATPLIRATIYLGEDDDVWLEQISSQGRVRRPRVDASRSAVTRLALERLREDMTAAQTVEVLASRSGNSTQTVGRKRL